MFLNKLIDEQDIWIDELSDQNIDKEAFKNHLNIFRDHFLKYNEERDTTPVSHTGKDEMTSLDFI